MKFIKGLFSLRSLWLKQLLLTRQWDESRPLSGTLGHYQEHLPPWRQLSGLWDEEEGPEQKVLLHPLHTSLSFRQGTSPFIAEFHRTVSLRGWLLGSLRIQLCLTTVYGPYAVCSAGCTSRGGLWLSVWQMAHFLILLSKERTLRGNTLGPGRISCAKGLVTPIT